LRQLLLDILPRNSEFSDYAITHHFEGRGMRHLLLNACRLARRDDRPGQILLAIEDITERVEAQDLREVLIHELSHRVKNTLATVQAIASHSARQAGSLDAFKESFNGRLQALSRAHDLLVETGWKGSEIEALARRTLDPYGVGDRVTLDGQEVTLRPQAGVAMVMILHELATNAAKYGALSGAEGHVSVTWRRADGRDGEQLHMDWTETAGPRVEKPSRRGFGTLLVERLATNDLHGAASIDYDPTGLRCTLTLPWSANVEPRKKVEA
jgi:two-component system CheB/CheR fusion protein